VPGHVGIDGNEITHQLAREDSSRQLIGPKPALGTSAKIARRVIRDWTCRTREEHWHSHAHKGQLRVFLKKPPLKKKSQGTAQSEQKPAKNNDRVANRTLSLKRTLI